MNKWKELVAVNISAMLALQSFAYSAGYKIEKVSDVHTALEEPSRENNSAEIEKLLGYDTKALNIGTNEIEVTVNENIISKLHRDLLGVQIEAGLEAYAGWMMEGEGLSEEAVRLAKSTVKIPSYRFGGGSSNFVNYPGSFGNFEDRASTKEFKMYGREYSSAAPNRFGLQEWLQFAELNNPDFKLMPCISVWLHTPDELKNFARILHDDAAGSAWGAKRAAAGIKDPIEVNYWELGNEIDQYFTTIPNDKPLGFGSGNYDREVWEGYCREYAEKCIVAIEAIREIDPEAKFLACGPTAPWDRFFGFCASDEERGWYSWVTEIMKYLAPYVDGISFHPYYDGYTSESVWFMIDDLKAELDRIVEENDIRDKNGTLKDMKVVGTEGAKFSDFSQWDYFTAISMGGAICTAHHFNQAFRREYYEGNHIHNIVSDGFWSFWQYRDHKLLETPISKMYALYNDYLGDRIVKSSYIWKNDHSPEDTNKYRQAPFSLVASANGENELTLILVNKESERDVDITFNFNNRYTLVEESVLTAPNPYTWAYNEACADMANISVTEKNIENFNSYHLENNSIAALRLKTKSKIPMKTSDKAADSDETISTDISSSFVDIQDNWARNEITLLRDMGYVSGFEGNVFMPEKSITKAEIAVMTAKALDLNTDYAGVGFRDYTADDWFAPYANAMKAEGFIRGEYFDAYKPITLSELCVLAERICLASIGAANTAVQVKGIENLSAEEQRHIQNIAGRGIINRLYENGCCDFERAATRAEAASVIYRLYAAIK